MTLNIDSVGEYTFHQEHEMLKDVKTDPYHHSNNKWRITPDKFEKKKELNQRMNNFLTHYKYLLSSASERPNSKIRLKHSLGILKIFDGGLGLKEEDDIPTDWLHSYFSDSQAVDMYKDINKHFRGKVIKGNQ
ncbi:MAG: hypothetical protein HKO66_15975, partial [Saprospiraceae bacterium]|nr:hypothetical protein [Saprospiraceae bacterium]